MITDYYELDWLEWGTLAIELKHNPELSEFATERFEKEYGLTYTGVINDDRKRVRQSEEMFRDVSPWMVNKILDANIEIVSLPNGFIEELRSQRDDLLKNDVITKAELML